MEEFRPCSSSDEPVHGIMSCTLIIIRYVSNHLVILGKNVIYVSGNRKLFCCSHILHHIDYKWHYTYCIIYCIRKAVVPLGFRRGWVLHTTFKYYAIAGNDAQNGLCGNQTKEMLFQIMYAIMKRVVKTIFNNNNHHLLSYFFFSKYVNYLFIKTRMSTALVQFYLIYYLCAMSVIIIYGTVCFILFLILDDLFPAFLHLDIRCTPLTIVRVGTAKLPNSREQQKRKNHNIAKFAK